MHNHYPNKNRNPKRVIFSVLFSLLFINLSIAQDNHVVTITNNSEFVQIQDYGEFMTAGNPYTVECLFKLNSLPNANISQAIFGSGEYFNPNFVRCSKPIVMVNRNNALGTYFEFILTERKNNNFGELVTLEIPYDLQTDTWYHVAFVYNGGNEFYFYVNGRRVGHATKRHFDLSCGRFSNNNMNIGGLNTSGANSFNLNGSVDEFRIWRKAKTEIEIQAEMYTHLTGSEDFLELYYDFDDAATPGYNPRNITDKTNNGNNAVATTLTNASWSDSANFSCFMGTINDDYLLPENWYNYQINPSNISINASTTIDRDLSLDNITIGSLGSLTVKNKSTITLDSYLHAQGEFIIEENSSLVQLDETIVNYYPITTERTGNTNEYRYSYWSFPSVNSVDYTYNRPPSSAPYTAIPNITKTLLTPEDVFNFGTGTGQRDPYWLFILTGTQGGFGNNADNVFWSQINQNQELEPGFGFTLKGANGSDTAHGKAIINGVPNNGDINVPLLYVDNNSYLIGNPYPSAISANEFINRNAETITGTLYFWEQWDGNSHNYDEYIGGYATYTKLGGVSTRNPAQSINNTTTRGTITPDDFISTGQGFVVETRTNNSANIIFDNDMRVGGNNTQFYREANVTESTRKKLWVDFYNQEGDFDQILIGTDPLATSGDDYGLDGKSIDFKEVYAYTMIDDEKYTVNALQSLERPIPLGINTNVNSEHTIAIWNQEGLSDYRIYLRDRVAHVTHNLKESSYTFQPEIGDTSERFEIVVRPELNRHAATTDVPLITLPNIQLRSQHNGIAIVTERTIEMIQVFDLNGQILHTSKHSKFINKKFEQGIYIIALTDSNGNQTRRKIFI